MLSCVSEEKALRKQFVHFMAVATALLLLSSVAAFADSYTFSLVPAGGSVKGAPGSVVGWGYTITNDSSTHWLDTSAVNAGIFRFATLDSGDYFSFPLVAPDSTVTVSFAPAGGSGFGEGLAALTWDLDAPLGFTNSGEFDLSACWANSLGTCIAAAPDVFAAYSATAAAISSAIPEPPGMALVALAAFVFSVVILIAKLAGLLQSHFRARLQG